MRAGVLTLAARKLQGSPAVEGKLPKDGLAVIRDDGGDPMPALAGPMVNGEETGDGQSVGTAPGGMEASTPRASGLPGRLDHDDAGVSGVHRSRIYGGLRPGPGCHANSEG